jgi:hypothetical protein
MASILCTLWMGQRNKLLCVHCTCIKEQDSDLCAEQTHM